LAIPIVCVVGRSNSGKTTLIERVVPELVRAGYRVATIKHAGHGFDLDTEGKDSWRHKRVGASSVVVVSNDRLAMFADLSGPMTAEEVRDRFLDASYDVIIAEGWKSLDGPKIVIIGDDLGEIPFSREGVLAVVSDQPVDLTVPVLDPADAPGVAAVIIARFPLIRRPCVDYESGV